MKHALVFAGDYAQAYEWIFHRPDLGVVSYYPMDESDDVDDIGMLHPELRGLNTSELAAFILPGAENYDVARVDWAAVVAVR